MDGTMMRKKCIDGVEKKKQGVMKGEGNLRYSSCVERKEDQIYAEKIGANISQHGYFHNMWK